MCCNSLNRKSMVCKPGVAFPISWSISLTDFCGQIYIQEHRTLHCLQNTISVIPNEVTWIMLLMNLILKANNNNYHRLPKMSPLHIDVSYSTDWHLTWLVSASSWKVMRLQWVTGEWGTRWQEACTVGFIWGSSCGDIAGHLLDCIGSCSWEHLRTVGISGREK